jgi:hypothetical protein
MPSRFGYAAEKLGLARSVLMLPHPRGEAASIAGAFATCDMGLKGIPHDELDDDARDWVRTLEALMETTGIDGPTDRVRWGLRAETLSEEEKSEVSRVVDELADWFRRESANEHR